MPIMKHMIVADGVISTDRLAGYGTQNVSNFLHVRITRNERFVSREGHIYGIENDWNGANGRVRTYNGIPKHHFRMFLKEWVAKVERPNQAGNGGRSLCKLPDPNWLPQPIVLSLPTSGAGHWENIGTDRAVSRLLRGI